MATIVASNEHHSRQQPPALPKPHTLTSSLRMSKLLRLNLSCKRLDEVTSQLRASPAAESAAAARSNSPKTPANPHDLAHSVPAHAAAGCWWETADRSAAQAYA